MFHFDIKLLEFSLEEFSFQNIFVLFRKRNMNDYQFYRKNYKIRFDLKQFTCFCEQYSCDDNLIFLKSQF